MTPEEKRQGAFEQFDQLLRGGMAVPKAVGVAAKDNGLRPENFRAFAEGQLGDLERYRARMMLRAEHDHVAALARGEIAKCRRREGPYKSVSGFFTGAEDAIEEQVGRQLGRPLVKTETWIIEDMWDEASTAELPEARPVSKRIRDWQRLQR